jgi:cyclopropane fatty-acyl-phospholipid synthase-like methyltransferase
VSDTERLDGLPGPRSARETEDFDALYAAGTPAWDIGRPQAAFAELAEQGRLVGRVLDVGCGTGEHALMAAALGLDVTGIDAAPTAPAKATEKARTRGLTVRFLEWSALDLGSLGDQFDTALDCGLFHVFDDEDRPRFVDSLRATIPVGGRYYMLCFSDRQPGDWGPRRISQSEIAASFAEGWRVDSIQPSTIEITVGPVGARAWLVTATRT